MNTSRTSHQFPSFPTSKRVHLTDEIQEIFSEDFGAKMRRPTIVDGKRIYYAREFLNKADYFAVGLWMKD